MEIERKFLVEGEWPRVEGMSIVQGYLGFGPVVRVRVVGERGWLTVKGEGLMVRGEWEYAVPAKEAGEMLEICEGVVEKRRWLVPMEDGHTFEVDEFMGDNSGLVVAEVELGAVDEEFMHPPWLGAEVTHDPRYHNSYLARHPFREWAASR